MKRTCGFFVFPYSKCCLPPIPPSSQLHLLPTYHLIVVLTMSKDSGNHPRPLQRGHDNIDASCRTHCQPTSQRRPHPLTTPTFDAVHRQFPDILPHILHGIIRHDLAAPFLYQLDEYAHDAEDDLLSRIEPQPSARGMWPYVWYRTPDAVLRPLQVYASVLISHAIETGGNVGEIALAFFRYNAHLATLAGKYEWDAVMRYHFAHHTRRLVEMRRGDFSGWGRCDDEDETLQGIFVYGHELPLMDEGSYFGSESELPDGISDYETNEGGEDQDDSDAVENLAEMISSEDREQLGTPESGSASSSLTVAESNGKVQKCAPMAESTPAKRHAALRELRQFLSERGADRVFTDANGGKSWLSQDPSSTSGEYRLRILGERSVSISSKSASVF
jgi:hypothetical protein